VKGNQGRPSPKAFSVGIPLILSPVVQREIYIAFSSPEKFHLFFE